MYYHSLISFVPRVSDILAKLLRELCQKSGRLVLSFLIQVIFDVNGYTMETTLQNNFAFVVFVIFTEKLFYETQNFFLCGQIKN